VQLVFAGDSDPFASEVGDFIQSRLPGIMRARTGRLIDGKGVAFQMSGCKAEDRKACALRSNGNI